MGSERRGNTWHYYLKVRDGDTVHSIHVGRELAPHFAKLDAARDSAALHRLECRIPIGPSTSELKRLLQDAETLRATLLYGSGYYRNRGEWRKHHYASLCRREEDRPSPRLETGQHSTTDTATMRAEHASTAACAPHESLHGFACPDTAYPIGETDGTFRDLDHTIRRLDGRAACPEDLRVIENVRLLPLVKAWLSRAQRLRAALMERLGNDSTLRSEAHGRALGSSVLKSDGLAWSWDGDPNYHIGLIPTIAVDAAYLTALDCITIEEYVQRHPTTYTRKQWTKMAAAAGARRRRAKKHLDEVVTLSRPHVRVLVEAGEQVVLGKSMR